MGLNVDDLIIENTFSANTITATTLVVGGSSISTTNTNFGSLSANTFSANTISASTIYSGSTNLYSIFQQIGGGSGTPTGIANGTNTYTGGTFFNPSVNVSALTINTLITSGASQLGTTTASSFSGGTISGGTLFSGSTNLYSIFQQLGGGSGTATGVSNGTNTYTGGTFFNPNVNISALTINTLTSSGASNFTAGITANTISATTYSAGTIYFTNINASANTISASGMSSVFVDSDRYLKTEDSAGFIRSYGSNFSTANQVISGTSGKTYITGSKIQIPTGKMQIGTMFRWTLSVSKTNAGTATSNYNITIGTAGTSADTAIVSFTKPAGTAAVDSGKIIIEAILRGPLSSSAIMVGDFAMSHSAATTGFLTIGGTAINSISSAFDCTVPNLNVGLCVTQGANDVYTYKLVMAEVWNI